MRRSDCGLRIADCGFSPRRSRCPAFDLRLLTPDSSLRQHRWLPHGLIRPQSLGFVFAVCPFGGKSAAGFHGHAVFSSPLFRVRLCDGLRARVVGPRSTTSDPFFDPPDLLRIKFVRFLWRHRFPVVLVCACDREPERAFVGLAAHDCWLAAVAALECLRRCPHVVTAFDFLLILAMAREALLVEKRRDAADEKHLGILGADEVRRGNRECEDEQDGFHRDADKAIVSRKVCWVLLLQKRSRKDAETQSESRAAKTNCESGTVCIEGGRVSNPPHSAFRGMHLGVERDSFTS